MKNGPINDGEESLITTAAQEDLFGILREGHVATSHGKEFALYKRLSRRYFNISREMCMQFVNDFVTCIKMKTSVKNARSRHRPILTVGFGSRGQVDFVDLQSSEYKGMKWLLSYCDHGTKFTYTTALPNKQVHSTSQLSPCK